MAGEIVQTLFGVTPESYQQQQSALADQQALQYARLSPFQQANYAIGRGAYQIAGALGGEDPELQKISQRHQIAGQINPNDPASIERGIVALSQGGDPEGAFMLQAEYRKMQESGALISQRQAAGRASKMQALPKEVQLAREVALLTGFEEGTPEYNTAFATSLQEQMAKPAKDIYGPIDPYKYTPASLAVFEVSQKPSDLVPITTPVAKSEFEKLLADSGLSEEEKQAMRIAKLQKETAKPVDRVEAKSEFEKLLADSGLSEEEKQAMRIAKLQKETAKPVDRVDAKSEFEKLLDNSDMTEEQKAAARRAKITKETAGPAERPESRSEFEKLLDNSDMTEEQKAAARRAKIAKETAGPADRVEAKSEFEKLLEASNMTPAQKEAARRAKITKESTTAASGGGGGVDADKVQSSKMTPDGTTILVMKNGTTRVISALGDELKGQARADAIRASEQFGADTQGTRAQARGIGELSSKQVGAAFAEVGKIKKNIGNIDDAIAAIDAGANTGVIASKLPNITAASIQLANVRQQLGLDVIGSVTFGALSEGELNLALDTALPTSLQPKDLRTYLVNKKSAQTKLAGYLTEQATYLTKPGNTLAGWLEKVENRAGVPAGVTVKKTSK